MSIIYTLICTNAKKVLAEFTEYQGNFEQVSRNLLKDVELESRATFSYSEQYYFHYINVDGLTYMCMCDDRLTQDTAFGYLEEINSMFKDQFSKEQINQAYSYSNINETFKDQIRSKMNYYNANLNESDRVAKLRKGVMDYKDNILQANNILSVRGEKIDLIVRKADKLRTESKNYYTSVSFSKLLPGEKNEELNKVAEY